MLSASHTTKNTCLLVECQRYLSAPLFIPFIPYPTVAPPPIRSYYTPHSHSSAVHSLHLNLLCLPSVPKNHLPCREAERFTTSQWSLRAVGPIPEFGRNFPYMTRFVFPLYHRDLLSQLRLRCSFGCTGPWRHPTRSLVTTTVAATETFKEKESGRPKPHWAASQCFLHI